MWCNIAKIFIDLSAGNVTETEVAKLAQRLNTDVEGLRQRTQREFAPKSAKEDKTVRIVVPPMITTYDAFTDEDLKDLALEGAD